MSIEQAGENIRRWREHPPTFVREVFGVIPDPWQDALLEAFPHKPRIAMKACAGPGKTALLAWMSWNFLFTRPHPEILATAISGENLRDNLWKEMEKWRMKSPMLTELFEWQAERIFLKASPATWYMAARRWSKSATPEQQGNTLRGLHSDYVMIVVDESGGIPQSVMATSENIGSSAIEWHIVQAGNPTHLEGPLYTACTNGRDLWHVVEISGDPDDPMRSPRVSIEWARNQIKLYGRDNPWVLVNVFGKFPPASLNALIGPDECAEASRRHLRIDQYDWAAKILGVDCARFGDDRTVIAQRQGLASFPMSVMRNAMTQDIGGPLLGIWREWGADACFIDNAMGNGVIDYAKMLDYDPIGVDFGGKPKDPRYVNKRAEMWFNCVEWIRAGAALPPDDELIAELCAPTYTFNAAGKIIVEPKDDVKARLGRSPDKADALCLTFADNVMPAERSPYPFLQRPQGRAETDYDPMSRA